VGGGGDGGVGGTGRPRDPSRAEVGIGEVVQHTTETVSHNRKASRAKTLKKALVTGAAGFIGSHLVERLIDEHWRVAGIDNFHPYYDRRLKADNLQGFLHHENFEFIEGSILSEGDLERCGPVDSVFHLAGIAGVRNSLECPDEHYKTNVRGSASLLSHFSNVDDLVFASSSSVYGDLKDEELPASETHPLNPISPYGDSKKQAEGLCLEYSRENNVRTSILRFHTVYGPRQRPDEAIMKFIGLAAAGRPVPVYGTGGKMRDYTFVSDIVDGMVLAQKRGSGVYNLGSGKSVSINEMVSMIEEGIGRKITRDHVEPHEGDVAKTHADISKARKELGFSPRTDLRSGIIRSIRWYRERTCA